MADETPVNGNYDAFDSITVPDSMIDAPDPAIAPAVPEVDANTAPDLSLVPDLPKETVPAVPGEPQWLDDGRFQMPDGSILSKEEVASLLGQNPAPAAVVPEIPKVDPIAEKLAAIEKMIGDQQAAAAKAAEPAKPDLIDPITEQVDWINGYIAQQHRAGRQITLEQAEFAHSRALAQAVTRQNQELRETFQKYEQERATHAERLKIEAEVQRIEATGKYRNVDSEMGKRLLNMILKEHSAKGERDLEKAYREAHEMVPQLVMQAYGNQKKEKQASVLRSMPRGGGTRPTPNQNFGKGEMEDFERLEAHLLKGR